MSLGGTFSQALNDATNACVEKVLKYSDGASERNEWSYMPCQII